MPPPPCRCDAIRLGDPLAGLACAGKWLSVGFVNGQTAEHMASSQSDFVATVPAVRDYGAGWKAVEGPAKAIAGLRFDPRQAG